MKNKKDNASINRINRDMAATIRYVWDELQKNPTEKHKTALMDLAIAMPWRFYDMVKGMLPKDIFITGDLNLTKMSPEELKAELKQLIESASGTTNQGD